MARPITVIGLAVGPATVPVKPPGLEVAVYRSIGLPPFAGVGKVIIACESPAVAVALAGAPGTVIAAGVTEAEAVDAAPVPTALRAVTVNV